MAATGQPSGLDYGPFIRILKELRELQLKHDFIEHADLSSRLIDLAHFESHDFVDELSSGNVWGGAGSIADLVFLGNVEGPEKDLLADEGAYTRLLFRLAEEMEAQGIRYEPAQNFANTMRVHMAAEFKRLREGHETSQ
jgi:hypothetical protein